MENIEKPSPEKRVTDFRYPLYDGVNFSVSTSSGPTGFSDQAAAAMQSHAKVLLETKKGEVEKLKGKAWDPKESVNVQVWTKSDGKISKMLIDGHKVKRVTEEQHRAAKTLLAEKRVPELTHQATIGFLWPNWARYRGTGGKRSRSNDGSITVRPVLSPPLSRKSGEKQEAGHLNSNNDEAPEKHQTELTNRWLRGQIEELQAKNAEQQKTIDAMRKTAEVAKQNLLQKDGQIAILEGMVANLEQMAERQEQLTTMAEKAEQEALARVSRFQEQLDEAKGLKELSQSQANNLFDLLAKARQELQTAERIRKKLSQELAGRVRKVQAKLDTVSKENAALRKEALTARQELKETLGKRELTADSAKIAQLEARIEQLLGDLLGRPLEVDATQLKEKDAEIARLREQLERALKQIEELEGKLGVAQKLAKGLEQRAQELGEKITGLTLAKIDAEVAVARKQAAFEQRGKEIERLKIEQGSARIARDAALEDEREAVRKRREMAVLLKEEERKVASLEAENVNLKDSVARLEEQVAELKAYKPYLKKFEAEEQWAQHVYSEGTRAHERYLERYNAQDEKVVALEAELERAKAKISQYEKWLLAAKQHIEKLQPNL